MKLKGEQVLLRMHLSNFTRWRTGPLHEAVVEKARREHLAGATVLSGFHGYVNRGPILGELEEVDALVREGLVTLEAVRVVRYEP